MTSTTFLFLWGGRRFTSCPGWTLILARAFGLVPGQKLLENLKKKEFIKEELVIIERNLPDRADPKSNVEPPSRMRIKPPYKKMDKI